MNQRIPIVTDYVMEIPYTWGFFNYQAPALLNYTAARRGFATPDLTKPFTYCDLGCGNGLTVVMLAAAFPYAEFWGIDFNPEHIENARNFAKLSGVANAHFAEATFGQATHLDMPNFDYITMHGIYSWVAKEPRDEIHDFIQNKAAKNCLVYLNYNAFPGATKLLPMWKAIQSFGAKSARPLIETVPAGVVTLKEIEALSGRFFRENPSAGRRLDGIGKRKLNYLVHEFGNGVFEPQFFVDVNKSFEKKGFHFAGSAELYRNTERYVLSRKFEPILASILDPSEREAMVSFIGNESFRWDVFARGDQSNDQQLEDKFRGQVFSLSGLRVQHRGKKDIGRRQIELETPVMQRILTVLADGCVAFEKLCSDISLKTYGCSNIAVALDQLMDAEVVMPAVRPAKKVGSKASHYTFSTPVSLKHLEERLFIDGRGYVISPVLGNAIRLGFMDACCLLALTGRKTSEKSGDALLRVLSSNSNATLTFGKIEVANLNSAFLSSYIRKFRAEKIPQLLMLDIIKSIGEA